jgi:hypothetical protein
LAGALDAAREVGLRHDAVGGKFGWQSALNFQQLARLFGDEIDAEVNYENVLHAGPSEVFVLGQLIFDSIAALDGH